MSKYFFNFSRLWSVPVEWSTRLTLSEKSLRYDAKKPDQGHQNYKPRSNHLQMGVLFLMLLNQRSSNESLTPISSGMLLEPAIIRPD